MKFANWGLFFALLCIGFSSFSQTDSVKLKVTITDSYSKRPLNGVSIIYPTTGESRTTNSRGYYEQWVNRTDTIFLYYPGYHIMEYSVADSPRKAEYVVHIPLEPFSTGLNQPVIIKAPKTLEQIEKERSGLGITPKELDRAPISISSPISALYEMFSARAKEKQKLKTQIVEDDRRRVFKELLAYYNEKKIIDLPENHYDKFIDFCNLPLDYLKYHSDYEIMKTVTTMFNKYARLSGLVK